MKYSVKGQKVVKEDFILEIEAESYEDVFKKTQEIHKHKAEIFKINDVYVTNQIEAKWQDKTNLSTQWFSIIPDLEIFIQSLKKIFQHNRAVKSFTVSFSGYGDDGRIDITTVNPDFLSVVLEEEVGYIQLFTDSRLLTIHEIIEQISKKLISYDSIPVDWSSGDGGRGDISFIADGDNIIVSIECCENEVIPANTFNTKVIL